MAIFSRLIQAGDRKISGLAGALQAFQNPMQYATEEVRRRLGVLAEEQALTPEQVLWLSNLLLDPRWIESTAEDNTPEDEELKAIVQQIMALEEEVHKLQSASPQP
jgi:hypothetical protein